MEKKFETEIDVGRGARSGACCIRSNFLISLFGTVLEWTKGRKRVCFVGDFQEFAKPIRVFFIDHGMEKEDHDGIIWGHPVEHGDQVVPGLFCNFVWERHNVLFFVHHLKIHVFLISKVVAFISLRSLIRLTIFSFF